MIKQNNNLTYIYETEFSNDNNILCEKNSLNILNVEYGTIDTYINVTNKAKEIFLKDNYFFISKKINLNNIFGDPCFGVEKELRIDVLLDNNIMNIKRICKKETNSRLEDDIIIYEKKNIDNLNVEYGANNTYINVTNKIKNQFFKNKKIFISNAINLNNIFGDPCYGIQKVIKINALINNTPIYICKQEINGYLEDDIVLCEKNELVILNVEYGCNNTYINVTNKVKELYLKNNNLILLKKINLNDIFGDTCSGIQKELKIDVLINNKYVCICEKEINGYLENDIIIICEINNLDFFNIDYDVINIINNSHNFCYNKPYESENLTDISISSFNTYSYYCEDSFINEDEILNNLPRGHHNSKQKINIDMLEKFILLIDFSNLGGGTSVFVESIISKYKKYQTFLIARNFNNNIYFTVNDEYELEKSYNNQDAYNLLLFLRGKIEKIFINHTINHSTDFLNNLFNLNINISTITHDFSCIFNEYQICFNDMNNYLNNETKRSCIDINKYDKIITQNKANMYIYSNYIEDKNKIVVTPLPDYKNSNIVVGIIGIISNIKGNEELKKIIDFYKNTNVKIVVFGSTGSYIESFDNNYTYKNINELNYLLLKHKPNIIIELSIWPETYSYTLSLGMITQLPILYLKKQNYCTVEDRLSKYDKAYSFNNIIELDKLIHDKKQDYFYTIEPIIYFNDFWDNYFITNKEKCIDNNLNDNNLNKNVFGINTYCIYFPQFHEFKENNISFYEGFTDIQNLSLLCNSNLKVENLTPSLTELNLNNINDYDYIKNKQILQKQIDIIYDYNISGFAIYYYWFSLNTITNKNTIMESVIDQFFNNSLEMKNRKVFFMWANESWTSNPAFGNTNQKIENDYSDISCIEQNIDNLIKYFKNDNYLKIDNKPVFEIHHPWFMNESDLNLFNHILNNKCLENNFNGVHFIVNAINGSYTNFINKMHHLNYKKKNNTSYDKNKKHTVLDYKNYINNSIEENDNNTIQTLVFDFDNRVRLFKPDKLSVSSVCINNTEFDKIIFIKKIIKKYNKNKSSDVENILLINSWNEWGEKMAIEPSEEYGYYYLNLIKTILENTPKI